MREWHEVHRVGFPVHCIGRRRCRCRWRHGKHEPGSALFLRPNGVQVRGYENARWNAPRWTDGCLQFDAHGKLCGVVCQRTQSITREAQDDFAIASYERAAAAWEAGAFEAEIIPVQVPQRRGDAIEVSEDEEFKAVRMDKIRGLRPAFQKEGTITAANASTLNDGASALVLASEEAVSRLGLKPIAKIVACADAAHEPEWFTTAPAKAVPVALSKAQWKQDDVDLWELNEAFSVVGIANMELLKLNPNSVNVNGGAVALGHPLGSSGSRIVVTLIHALRNRGLTKGGAGICNGGGGASALMVETL